MKLNKLFKGLTLVFCIMLVFGLVACKEDTASDKADSSSKVSSDEPSSSDKTESTTSGIELEEDVFDDGVNESRPSNNSASIGTDNKVNQSADNNESNTSSDKTESNNSSGNNSSTESGETSSDENLTESDDGTVKLPIDWF